MCKTLRPRRAGGRVSQSRDTAISTLNDTKLNKSGGKITGDVIIDGKLYVGDSPSQATLPAYEVPSKSYVSQTANNLVKSHNESLLAHNELFNAIADDYNTKLNYKLDLSGGTVTGDIIMPNGLLDAGDVITRSYYDFLTPDQGARYLAAPENSGKALTDADISDSSSALGVALAGKADRTDIDAAISPTSPAFSYAVLSVGLGIDTNTVAVINELVDSAHDLPVTGATSVGALLLALAAAVAALKKRLPYTLVAKTIENGEVTLDDRASNAVEISATLSPNTLTVNFPTATSGKVRDFALRLNIASGVTAPELVLPQGVVCENADGEVPEISDGGTDGSSTILYFSETENNGTTAKFLLKGEMLAAITQA